jgi:hypothetical protein
MAMMPLHPLGFRRAAPFLFLLVIGGVMAFAEYWMSRQLPRGAAVRRGQR